MSTLTGRPPAVATGWLTACECRVEDLREIVEQTTTLADYLQADEVVQNVLIYRPSSRTRSSRWSARPDWGRTTGSPRK
jgi:hypothetical protein